MSEITKRSNNFCSGALYSENIGEFLRYVVRFENRAFGIEREIQALDEKEALKVFTSYALAI